MSIDRLKLYLTQKEAVERYGYSSAWFERERWKGTGPSYLKIRGKILYPIESTDSFFHAFGTQTSTSEDANHEN